MTKTLKEKGVEPRLRGYVLCSREVLDDESPTSANLGNESWFYNQSSKWRCTYAQSGDVRMLKVEMYLCSKWTISYDWRVEFFLKKFLIFNFYLFILKYQ